MKNIGIYLHIPFCRNKCNYCDFLTITNNNSNKINLYVDYLCKEIILMKDFSKYKLVDTIYFGGGTPSLLSIENIEKIMSTIYNNYNVCDKAEITIEINPETIDDVWIRSLSKTNVNRVSVGFQNSNDEILKLIGREGSLKQFINCINYLKIFGITNISSDIILSLPSMDVEKTISDAKFICDFEIPHISAYSLILEKNTKLYRDVMRGRINLPSVDLDREIYHSFCDYLITRGYHRYEVSSFCKKDYESKHNKKYWDLSEYIGLGLGASGLLDNMRTKNPTRIKDYYEKIDLNLAPFCVEYNLTLKDMMSEYSFLSIRTSNGINKKDFFKKFGKKFDDVFDLNEHFINQLIYEEEDSIKLTEKGFDLSNIVEMDLLL